MNRRENHTATPQSQTRLRKQLSLPRKRADLKLIFAAAPLLSAWALVSLFLAHELSHRAQEVQIVEVAVERSLPPQAAEPLPPAEAPGDSAATLERLIKMSPVVHRAGKNFIAFDAGLLRATGPVESVVNPESDVEFFWTRVAEKSTWVDALLQEQVNAFDARGEVCSASLVKPQLAVSGFSYEARRKVDLQVWQGYATDRMLILELKSNEGSCDDALWAHSAISGDENTAPAPKVFETIQAKDDARQSALDAFRELPEFRKIQSDYRRETGFVTDWIDDEDSGLTVQVLGGEMGEPSLLVMATVGGCGEFTADLSALWQPSNDVWTLLNTEGAFPDIVSVVDENADERLKLIGTQNYAERVIYALEGGEFRVEKDAPIVSEVCTC